MHRGVVAALCLVQFVDVLVVTSATTAIPAVLADLDAPASAAGPIAIAYPTVFGGLLVLGGRLGDRYGPRRVLLGGLVVFTVAGLAGSLALDVVQVVGAALVDGDRVLVAQRSGGSYDGCWEFPGGKVEPGEEELAALVREIGEELGVAVVPEAFLGEVVLDGVVAGGLPGASTLRVWWGRVRPGSEVTAHEHSELRWLTADELESLDWIPADRPLLPAVRALLARLRGDRP